MNALEILRQRQNQFEQYLLPYQKDFLIQSQKYPKFGCFVQIGGGKTFIAINWINQNFIQNHFQNVIIFAPATKLSDWNRDLLGHLGKIDHAYLPFETKIIQSKHDLIHLTNAKPYCIFLCSISLLGSNSMQEFLNTYANSLTNLAYVFDESSKLKNHNSITSKNLIKLNFYVKYALLLSGSLMSNGYKDLTTQFFLLDIDLSLNNANPIQYTYWWRYYSSKQIQYELFLSLYCIIEKKEIKVYNKQGILLTQEINEITGYKNEDILRQKINERSFVFTKKAETNSINPNLVVTKKEHYNVYEEILHVPYFAQWINYNNFNADLQAFSKLYKLEKNGAMLNLIAREWCSGFLKISNLWQELFPTLTFNELIATKNLKWKVLVNYLFKINFQSVIIFYNFKFELEILKKILVKYHYVIHEVNGEHKFSQIEKNETNAQAILIQYKSGATGLNLQHLAHHLVFYSVSTSCDDYIQAKGRIDRVGQIHDCYIVNLITLNSVEEKIYQVLQTRKNYIDKMFELTPLKPVELKKSVKFNNELITKVEEEFAKNKISYKKR